MRANTLCCDGMQGHGQALLLHQPYFSSASANAWTILTIRDGIRLLIPVGTHEVGKRVLVPKTFFEAAAYLFRDYR